MSGEDGQAAPSLKERVVEELKVYWVRHKPNSMR
jgi:hypothetical protein